MRGWQAPAGAVAARTIDRTRSDALTLAIGAMILAFVWRFQQLYPLLGTIQFPVIASAAAVLIFFGDKDASRSVRHLNQPVIKLALAIFLLAVASVPTSVYPGKSFAFIHQDLAKTLLLMALVAASIRTVKDVERFAWIQIFGAVVYSVYVHRHFTMQGGRLGDLVTYDSNDLGMMIVATLPLLIYFISRAPRWWVRGVSGAAFAVLMYTLVKTGSRGAFLGLLALAVYYLFGYSSIPKAARIGAVGGGFLLLMVLGNQSYWDMMGTMLNPKADYNWSGKADTGRMEIWKRGLGYMFSHPLTGVGARSFSVAEGRISEISKRQQFGVGLKWSEAHNSFIEIGAELGVFGLAAFLTLLFHAYRAARAPGAVSGQKGGRAPPGEIALGQALAGTIVAYAVSGFFLSQAYAAYAFTIYGMIAGYAHVVARSSSPVLVAKKALARVVAPAKRPARAVLLPLAPSGPAR
jgi:O-antigen ligase